MRPRLQRGHIWCHIADCSRFASKLAKRRGVLIEGVTVLMIDDNVDKNGRSKLTALEYRPSLIFDNEFGIVDNNESMFLSKLL